MLLKIEGMGCMRCVAKVKKAMEEIGAKVISCEIGVCEIEGVSDTDLIRDTIKGIGFELISAE